MASPPPAAQIVGPIANNRIADRVNDQGAQNGQPHQPGIEADDLTVKQEKEKIEAVVFDAVGNRANPLRQFGPDRGGGDIGNAASRVGTGGCTRHIVLPGFVSVYSAGLSSDCMRQSWRGTWCRAPP